MGDSPPGLDRQNLDHVIREGIDLGNRGIDRAQLEVRP